MTYLVRVGSQQILIEAITCMTTAERSSHESLPTGMALRACPPAEAWDCPHRGTGRGDDFPDLGLLLIAPTDFGLDASGFDAINYEVEIRSDALVRGCMGGWEIGKDGERNKQVEWRIIA